MAPHPPLAWASPSQSGVVAFRWLSTRNPAALPRLRALPMPTLIRFLRRSAHGVWAPMWRTGWPTRGPCPTGRLVCGKWVCSPLGQPGLIILLCSLVDDRGRPELENGNRGMRAGQYHHGLGHYRQRQNRGYGASCSAPFPRSSPSASQRASKLNPFQLHVPFPVLARMPFGYYFSYFVVVSRCALAIIWLG